MLAYKAAMVSSRVGEMVKMGKQERQKYIKGDMCASVNSCL